MVKKYSHLVNDDAIDLAKFSGKPKTTELLHFKKSGGSNNFSRRKYQNINQELAKYTVKSKPSDK